MTVLPLNASVELNREPNPFEKSFSTTAHAKDVPSQPSETTYRSTAAEVSLLKDTAKVHYEWGQTLPSTSIAPTATSIKTYISNKVSNSSAVFVDLQQERTKIANASPTPDREGDAETVKSDKRGGTYTRRKGSKKPRTMEEDEKRKNFLERNRLAALKCRQRKKQWLNNLQSKVELLTTDNDQLRMQSNTLREEVVNLKTLLLAHKDCLGASHQENIFDSSSIGTTNTMSIMMQPTTVSPLSINLLYPNYSSPLITSAPTSSILQITSAQSTYQPQQPQQKHQHTSPLVRSIPHCGIAAPLSTGQTQYS